MSFFGPWPALQDQLKKDMLPKVVKDRKIRFNMFEPLCLVCASFFGMETLNNINMIIEKKIYIYIIYDSFL